VHIFELGVPSEFARADLAKNLVKPRVNRIALRLCNNTHVREHGRMRFAPLHVERRQTAVE